MWDFLGVMGFLGTIVFIVLAIVFAFMKNRKGKKMMMYAGICVVIFFVGVMNAPLPNTETVSSNNESNANTYEEDSNQEENDDNLSEEEPDEQSNSIGDKVQLGDHGVTVLEVEKSAGTEYDQPKSGKEFVIISVKIENVGDNNISYNPYDFSVLNSQGQINDAVFTFVDQDTSLNHGELAPGGSVEGTLTFEQPKDDDGLILFFEPNLWSNKKIEIKLQ